MVGISLFSPNTLHLDDFDGDRAERGGLSLSGAERVVAHFAFDTARDDAPPPRRDHLVAQLTQDRAVRARQVLRGEWPPDEGASGGSRESHARTRGNRDRAPAAARRARLHA